MGKSKVSERTLKMHHQIYDLVMEFIDLHKYSVNEVGVCMTNILIDLMHMDGFCEEACIEYFAEVVAGKAVIREMLLNKN